MLRKLARIILNALTALSLVLCVAACVLWVRSYSHHDNLTGLHADGLRMWESVACSMHYWRSPSTLLARVKGFLGWTYEHRPNALYREVWGRFEITHRGPGDINIWVPYWMTCAACAFLPACWLVRPFVRRRRDRSRTSGLCRVCGYDLRATPARCPECGRAATTIA
jgi:hypothetical protein